MGAFSLVRFRSAPGSAKEIGAIFLAMGTGLVVGMGYLGYALLCTLILGAASVLYGQLDFGARKRASLYRTLHITIPEDLDYTGAVSYTHLQGLLSAGKPHPRSYGTFGRIFSYYVRERGLLTFEQAVHKMTHLSAQRLGIGADRGLIKEQYFADVVVFDPHTIADRATYASPKQYTQGLSLIHI